ncbi:MAG: winged helix-turn-helix transcriptional regulator [Actinomycetota bacterium]
MARRTEAADTGDRKSYEQFCPIARALDIVGDRWTLLILRDVSLHGPRRFVDLREGLEGVPPTLLSSRLKSLVADGILERTAGPGRTVSYGFTPRGREIRPVLAALRDFGAPLMPAGWEKKMPPQVFGRR